MSEHRPVTSTLARQFGWPQGMLGSLAGFVMAVRPSNRERGRRTLDRLDIRPGDTVLEIGFGPGVALAWAAARAAPGVVIGLDCSTVMVRQAARRNARRIASGQVRLLEAAIETPPLLDVRFDKVYAINVAMFWPQPAAVLSVVRGLMRPDGRIALPHQPRQAGARDGDARRGGERLAEALRAAGFVDVRPERLEMKPVDAVCVLARAPGATAR